jgi:crooked neck
LTLEEQSGSSVAKIRELYERAVAQVPTVMTKKAWKRYIYLWVNYAIFEELTASDLARARQVYERLIKLVPHREFSFSKIWILYAHFLVRQADLDKARKVLGMALGMCPLPKLFKAYADLEL